MLTEPITLEFRGRAAILKLNRPQRLNSLGRKDFQLLGELLRNISLRKDIIITILLGTGHVFSSGADFLELSKATMSRNRDDIMRDSFFLNVDLTRAFYTHPKILIVALNGPVVGLLAALISFADFIYAVPEASLLVPFSSLGLGAEGGASRALQRRLGFSKAREVLLLSKRIPCQDLLTCGFVNRIIDPIVSESDSTATSFLEIVLQHVNKDIGDHIDPSSLLKIKEQLCLDDRRDSDRAAVDEAYTAVDRILSGSPAKQLKQLTTRKHVKL